MFYSQQCLVSRKGPLGAIWVAAYFYKKLKKAQIKDTHIPSSVDQILQKELDTLAYRVLAYLLLGVVRIYSKKVDFLFHDCNRALVGVKEFVAKEKNRESNTNVALPAASSGFFSIALPESFELDAFDLGVLDDFHGGNVKPQEDITLKEDGGAGRDTESMDQYYNERFDMEEDLLSTFHETFVTDHTDTRRESSAHDMDIDAESDRYATGETSARVVEAEPLISNKSSRDHQTASRNGEDPESDDMLVEPQVSEDIIRAQEEATARETICNIVQRLVDPESDDMLVELQASEDVRRAQEEDTICTVMDPHESPGDNPHRDGHRENLESERASVETGWEKTPHDESLPSECKSPEEIQGSENQPSGASRIDGEKEIPEMSTREETGAGSVSENKDLPEGIEKHRRHNDEEMTDTDMFHGSHKEPSETPEKNQVRHSVTEKGFLSDNTFSEEWGKGSNAQDTPVAGTPKPASCLNISEGETSHQFSIIPTPAGKESSRVSRKRKCLIDDEVMIPSIVMKKMIEDPSKLVAKRRRVPYTDYPEKRIKRFTDPSKSSWDPLLPYGSLELQSLFCQPIKLKEQSTTETPKAAKNTGRMKKSSLRTAGSRGDVSPSEQAENGREIMETPQAAALTELRITVPETVENNREVSAETGTSSVAGGSAHPKNVPPETPAKAAEPAAELAPETPARTSEQIGIAPETPIVSEQVEIAPETPVRESMSKRYFNDHETCEQETRPANSFTSFEKRPSECCEDRRDLDAILMNEEVNAHETEDLQKETWSARTRSVAKFLEKTFLEQREKVEEEKASLLQLCRGRTQKESARLFYETLVLKTKGYLEVKQDHPYSDVLLSRFSRQQEAY
ncbi:Sister chromatid cohesion 1 protein 2 [Hirschfeldia incana]|nr:Sister chromatid cohesion 1 protein 2 [Hirschfeldia incana]